MLKTSLSHSSNKYECDICDIRKKKLKTLTTVMIIQAKIRAMMVQVLLELTTTTTKTLLLGTFPYLLNFAVTETVASHDNANNNVERKDIKTFHSNGRMADYGQQWNYPNADASQYVQIVCYLCMLTHAAWAPWE